MSEVVWREDDFEERGSDIRMFSSASANTSISENERLFPFGRQKLADIICIGLDGRIVTLEAKSYSNRNQREVVLLCSWRGQWVHGESLIRLQSDVLLYPVHTGVALSRASIDELSRQVERNASVSASYADLHEVDQYQNVAAHPLTRLVHEQLASVPESSKEPILLVLKQFVTCLPKTDTTKLLPLRLAILDDSSYLLEWTFKDRRLGFSFEADPKDSGWYYVYSRASSERYESGTMDQLEMTRLIEMTLKT